MHSKLPSFSDCCSSWTIKGYLRRLLESSVSTKLVSQLESFLKSRNKEDELKNLWPLSAPARRDFRNGHLEIRRTPLYGGIDFHIEEEKPEQEVRLRTPWRTNHIFLQTLVLNLFNQVENRHDSSHAELAGHKSFQSENTG